MSGGTRRPPVLRRRLVVVLAAATAALLVGAAPAGAHTRVAEASNLHSEITDAPPAAGVTWRVHSAGELLALRNDGPSEVVVLGYEDEPFLRVGPEGVHENLNSPATYLNSDRYGDVALPPRADAEVAPEWRMVSTEPAHVWHDHRTHWMSPALPPVVRSSPGEPHHVLDWVIPITVDGAPTALRGVLRWEPLPTRWFWWVGMIAAALAAAVLARRAAHPVAVGAVAVGGVALLNGIHLVDEIVARPQDLLDVLSSFLHTGFFVALALAAALWVWHGQDGRRLALGIGAGGILFHQGLLQLGVLSATSMDTIWPLWSLRTLVVLSVAQAAIAAVAIWRTRVEAGRGPGQRGSLGPSDRGRVPVGVG
jgi:hypothetical protein